MIQIHPTEKEKLLAKLRDDPLPDDLDAKLEVLVPMLRAGEVLSILQDKLEDPRMIAAMMRGVLFMSVYKWEKVRGEILSTLHGYLHHVHLGLVIHAEDILGGLNALPDSYSRQGVHRWKAPAPL